MSDLLNRVRDIGIIPVIKLNSVEQAVPLAKALIDGGIPAAEVTFRTEAAADGIKAIKEAYPEMLLGAGTVINKDYAKKAIDAGAEFIVSPGFNPEVVDFVLDNGVPMIPGVANPGQIEQALCIPEDTAAPFIWSLNTHVASGPVIAEVTIGGIQIRGLRTILPI